MWEWLREHKIGAGIGAVIFAALLSTTLQGGDESPIPFTTSTTANRAADGPRTSTSSDGVAAADSNRPEIPPLSCDTLIDPDDVVIALGSEDRPYSELSSFRISRGEVCQETLASDDAYFIRLEPGDPSDFAAGATLNGATGVAVPNIGDGARWFAGDGVPALLAVYEETSVGDLVFRVSIGRPDLAPEEQLPVVTEWARAVLSRFPYVEVEQPEPVTVHFDREVPNPPAPRFDGLVVAGAESGEWTEGEGLVAALRSLAGEPSDFRLPEDIDLLNGSATGLMLMAESYAVEGPDEAARTEIERLLGQYEFPQPTETVSTEALSGPESNVVISAPVVGGWLVAQQEEPPAVGCGLDPVWFDVDCMKIETIGDVRFGYPRRVEDGTVEGWDADDIANIRLGVQTAVAEYTKHGTLSRADIEVTALEGSLGEGIHNVEGGVCLVQLRKSVQALTPERQRFFVAMELAGCFLFENLPHEVFSSYAATKWWYQGAVVYLAAEAFPDLNFEWEGPITQLEGLELETSLQDRSVTNWPFFRSVAAHGGGPAAVLNTIRPLTNATSKGAQQERLAGQSTSGPALHVYHEELTDQKISDPRPPGITYTPPAWDIEMSGPTIITDEPIRFGVSRYHVTVESGKTACLEYDISSDVLTSWRRGKPGTGAGGWTFDLPSEITGDSVFVATTVQDGQSFSISAKVSEDPGCDEDNQPSEIELPDCGICDPSLFYRFLGAVAAASGA